MPTNLAQVLTIVERKPGGRPSDEMACAVRRVGEALALDLGEIPAAPARLAKLIAHANPALAKMNLKRWGRVRSLVRQALVVAGFKVMPGRDAAGLAPAWKAVVDPLPKRYRFGLSSFFSDCSRSAIAPSSVVQATFDAYHEKLKTSFEPNPDRRYHDTINLWNELVARTPDWPAGAVTPPPDSRRAILPRESFPASFRADVEACLNQAGDPDIFGDDYWRALRPATVKARRVQIFHAARTLAVTGFPISKITSLAVLTEVANVKAVLQRLRNEHGGVANPATGVLAQTLKSIARRWVKPNEKDLNQLADFARRLTVRQTHMTKKNLELLRQFDDPRNVRALLYLPERVLREVERNDLGAEKDAIRIMRALVVEIFTAAPMRMANITGLRRDRHIRIERRGRKSIARITIPGDEVKNGTPIEMVLTEDHTRLLNVYLSKYRGRVFGGAGPYLFPGPNGDRRSESSFGASISLFIKREIGLQMHPHLFRQFAAQQYLRDHPDQIGVVRLLLGHTTTKTTETAYAVPRTEWAFAKWAQTLARLRDDAGQVRRL